MKICIVCPSIYPENLGGDGKSIYLLSRYMRQSGHYVVVVTFDSSLSLIENRDSGRVYRFPGLVEMAAGFRPRKSGNVFVDSVRENELFWIHVASAVMSVNRKEKPDVIHWYTFSPPPAMKYLTACPQISTLNTFWVTCVKGTNVLPNGKFCSFCTYANLQRCLSAGVPPYGQIPAGHLSFIRAKILLWERKYIANGMDKIITLSYATKNLVQRNGISPSKIEVIPNMYDPQFLKMVDFYSKEPREKVRRDLGLNSDSFVVSYIGRIVSEKGVGYLLESIPSILRRFPRTCFAFAGKGPETAKLVNQANHLKVRPNVIFTGLLDTDSLAKLYSISDLIVAPQIIFEAFGRSILEAMLASKPVITTNVGAPKEFVSHKKTGIVIPACDSNAIAEWTIKLLEDNELRQTLGANARIYAESMFSPEIVLQKIECLYRSVL
jgi:glycosyltransferase involved in cell wall biosynthesis